MTEKEFLDELSSIGINLTSREMDMFKKYANYINKNLGYDISRLGNKKEDYEKSNMEYEEKAYKYTIKCTSCGKEFHRNRLNKDFFRKLEIELKTTIYHKKENFWIYGATVR